MMFRTAKDCVLPGCQDGVQTQNRAGQDTCVCHELVVVSGSYFDDRHHGAS